MTELERQLTAALVRLSAQFETEQQRHSDEQRQQSEQVEALQQRVERQTAESETLRQRIAQLSGQLRCLVADFRTLAATLRGRWN